MSFVEPMSPLLANGPDQVVADGPPWLGYGPDDFLWDDPFEPRTLQKMAAHRENLRQTRLLAEEAQEHFYGALKLKGDPATLGSLLLESRMLDYAGLKYLTALESADRWKEMRPKVHTEIWWNTFDSEGTYQSHARPIDLMDQITELRRIYRRAWLAEYTEYRLDSTLVRWDAEGDIGDFPDPGWGYGGQAAGERNVLHHVLPG